jgi:hypothetical protein
LIKQTLRFGSTTGKLYIFKKIKENSFFSKKIINYLGSIKDKDYLFGSKKTNYFFTKILKIKIFEDLEKI